MDYTQHIEALQQADRKIKRAHRYTCGLVDDAQAETLKSGSAYFFFESPDGQNGELFYALKELGYRASGYTAPYDWAVSKDGVRIKYTEGDIYLSPLKK